MMARFYGYLDKVFDFRRLTALLSDSRSAAVIPTAAIFGTAFAMFATGRGSLNGIDKERHFPGRLRNFVGPRVPSGDSVGRVYAQWDSSLLREVLRDVHLRIKRNKVLHGGGDWMFAAGFKTPKDCSPNAPPTASGPRVGEPSNTGTTRVLPLPKASPSPCGYCTPKRPNNDENGSPLKGRTPSRSPRGTGPRHSAVGSYPRGRSARRPLALGHREWLLQQHLDPLGPGSCLQARTDGNRQFRAHAVSGLHSPAMLLATEPQAALS